MKSKDVGPKCYDTVFPPQSGIFTPGFNFLFISIKPH